MAVTALGLFLFVPAAIAAPSLTVEATDAAVGGTIRAVADLSETPNATGEISFEVFGPNDPTCSGTALDQSSATVSGEGQYASEDFTPPAAGTYHWSAHYSGDGENPAADAVCSAASTVAKVSPSLSGSATSTVVVGSTVTDTATLSGGFSPTGQLVFRAHGPADETCGAPPAYEETVAVSGNGAYSPAGFAPGPGVYRWTVEYAGDANNEATALTCGAPEQASTVTKASPVLTADASSGPVGTAIRDKATLAGGFSPGGEVTFSVFGPADTTCATPLATTSVPIDEGQATAPDFIAQQAGEFRWTASYSGDANNEPVHLACGAANQTSTVAKASPALSGTATSAVIVGTAITDNVTLSSGFAPGGELVFRAYGPGDEACGTSPAYEETVAVNGNGPYSPPGFAPGPGVYRWTVEYTGDGNNGATALPCGAPDQASAVGTIDVTLASGASGGTIGNPVTASATLREGATPTGQITFRAFPPGDVSCAGAPVFSSAVKVSGNGSYRSTALMPTKVGTFRWTVTYSGDPNHAAATSGCGIAASRVTQASPSIAGAVPQRVTVGAPFWDTATLRGGFAPGGTITFRIYGPVGSGCAKPAFVNIVAVNGNGTFNSDPFVALRPGRYSFLASYSGDAANQKASEPCDSPAQVVQVGKRSPKVKPRAVLVGDREIAIRARLSGGVSPTGALTFRLYGPDDKRCKRKPAFSGGVSVRRNGTFSLGRYIATKPGTYRLSIGYSGDRRNQRYKASCKGAQSIRVK
jgi:hypothetical protein